MIIEEKLQTWSKKAFTGEKVMSFSSIEMGNRFVYLKNMKRLFLHIE